MAKPVAFYSDKASVFRPTRDSAECGGRTVTQFGRVLCELDIDSWCANLEPGQGARRARQPDATGPPGQGAAPARHLLAGGGQCLRPRFVADFNKRFEKSPKSDFDAHRPVRDDEDLDLIFSARCRRRSPCSMTECATCCRTFPRAGN